MHFPTFKYAIRRITVDADSPVAVILKKAGYVWEPLVEFLTEQEAEGREYFERYERFRPSADMAPYKSTTSVVFECPIEQGQARPAQEVSAWEQFALLAMLQREWSDNSVSCTVYFDPKMEGHQIPQMLTSFVPVVKSVSMLPHDNDSYAQMPYEGITEDEYHKKIETLQSLDWSTLEGSDGDQLVEMYCASDRCTIQFK
jgi:ribonucleoside-diphosphate reductase alpha chain